MGIFKVFDLLMKVGTAFSILGELITRLGVGGRVLTLPPAAEPDSQSMSQDSSNPMGVEDEKPAEEEANSETSESGLTTHRRGDKESSHSSNPSEPLD